ncbi:hypothetical protein KIPB_010793, partial [Kipferlia bialata]|eukprot:g10793.t1
MGDAGDSMLELQSAMESPSSMEEEGRGGERRESMGGEMSGGSVSDTQIVEGESPLAGEGVPVGMDSTLGPRFDTDSIGGTSPMCHQEGVGGMMDDDSMSMMDGMGQEGEGKGEGGSPVMSRQNSSVHSQLNPSMLMGGTPTIVQDSPAVFSDPMGHTHPVSTKVQFQTPAHIATPHPGRMGPPGSGLTTEYRSGYGTSPEVTRDREREAASRVVEAKVDSQSRAMEVIQSMMLQLQRDLRDERRERLENERQHKQQIDSLIQNMMQMNHRDGRPVTEKDVERIVDTALEKQKNSRLEMRVSRLEETTSMPGASVSYPSMAT